MTCRIHERFFITLALVLFFAPDLQAVDSDQAPGTNPLPAASLQATEKNWWRLGEKPLPKPSPDATARRGNDGRIFWVMPGAGKNDVLFEFYSSCEPEVRFAYLYKLDDKWRFESMAREGNRFYLNHPVENEIWYEFVVSPNVWYRKDPFNEHVDHNHPYLKRGNQALTTHRNLQVRYISSAHFDYFTTGDGHKIDTLESLYRELTERKLALFGSGLGPSHGKKIRYYGGMFKGAYATAGNAELVEGGDYPNSHELIHVLMAQYPPYPPFAEGLAQCFQERGNRRPLAEQNCSLAAKSKLQRTRLWDVLSDFQHHNDYHLAGSFIYYHMFVERQLREPFIAFLKELRSGLNLSFDQVAALYRKHLGAEMKSTIGKWEAWVRQVNESSDVYVEWNSE